MSTASFDSTNAAITFLGQFGYVPLASQNGYGIRGTNSEVRFRAVGTDLSVTLLVTATGTNYLQVSIDGGSFTNLSISGLTANTWTSVSVFSSLSDASHNVIIRHVTGTATSVVFQVSGMLSLTGSAPALAAADSCGPLYDAAAYPLLGATAIEGGCSTIGTSGYTNPPLVSMPWGDGTIRIKTDAPTISIWCINNGAIIAVLKSDGTQLAKTTLATGNSYGLTTFATGLTGVQDLEIVSVASPTIQAQIAQVMLSGGTLYSGGYVKPRGLLVGYGDSKTGGNGTGTGGDSSLSWLNKLARIKNRQPENRGTSGQRTIPQSPTAVAGENRTSDCYQFQNNANIDPDELIWAFGHNDAANLVSRTDFAAGVLYSLQKIANAIPNCKVHVLGIFNTSAFSTTVRGNYNSDIAGAVATLANANVAYINTDGWIDATLDTADGTHPTPAGADKIVTQLSPYVSSWTAPTGGLARTPYMTILGA